MRGSMRHTSKYLIVPQGQRRFHNTYRKNTYAPAYARDVLYKGWEFLYAHVLKHGSFPA